MNATAVESSEGEPRAFDVKDAAIFETYVVPAYLSLFAEPMLELLIGMRDARVCHAHCRTGYPDSGLLAKLPNVHLYGCDESEPALALARAKAMGITGFTADFRRTRGPKLPFPDGAFSHAFTIHPSSVREARALLLSELGRIVAPRGQALVGLPLRGSFEEVDDLLREAALRLERPSLGEAVDVESAARADGRGLRSELEAAGLDHVELTSGTRTLSFASGRELVESPVFRLLVLPDIRQHMGAALVEADMAPALRYVRDAVDTYWSDGGFELTINVGVASARRPG